ILGTAILQPRLRTPRHGSLVPVDDRCAELALGRFLLREHTGQVARLRLAERMLLPARVLGIQSRNGGSVMLAPAALPNLCPPLSCLPRVHPPRVNRGTDTPPDRQHGERPVALICDVPYRSRRFSGSPSRARDSDRHCLSAGSPAPGCHRLVLVW